MNWLVIAIAVSLVTSLLGMLSLIAFLAIRQQRQIQSLTNLAAAKDLAAFTTLENVSLPNSTSGSAELFIPMDDESMALRMREQYASHGLNPNSATDHPEDPWDEIGGIGNLL